MNEIFNYLLNLAMVQIIFIFVLLIWFWDDLK
jgi:hypothetical protein